MFIVCAHIGPGLLGISVVSGHHTKLGELHSCPYDNN